MRNDRFWQIVIISREWSRWCELIEWSSRKITRWVKISKSGFAAFQFECATHKISFVYHAARCSRTVQTTKKLERKLSHPKIKILMKIKKTTRVVCVHVSQHWGLVWGKIGLLKPANCHYIMLHLQFFQLHTPQFYVFLRHLNSLCCLFARRERAPYLIEANFNNFDSLKFLCKKKCREKRNKNRIFLSKLSFGFAFFYFCEKK